MTLRRPTLTVRTVDTVDTVDMPARNWLKAARVLPGQMKFVQSRASHRARVFALSVHRVHPARRGVAMTAPSRLTANGLA
jgi:hypothetical protein